MRNYSIIVKNHLAANKNGYRDFDRQALKH